MAARSIQELFNIRVFQPSGLILSHIMSVWEMLHRCLLMVVGIIRWEYSLPILFSAEAWCAEIMPKSFQSIYSFIPEKRPFFPVEKQPINYHYFHVIDTAERPPKTYIRIYIVKSAFFMTRAEGLGPIKYQYF